MPEPKQNQSQSSLSPGQAAYVLDRLVRERRISKGEINRYVSEMGHEINELEQRLARLRAAHGGASTSAPAPVAPARRGPGRPPGSGTPARRGPGRPPRAAAPVEAAAPSAPASKKGGSKRGKAGITAEQLASRQLQGRYLALVRRFPARKRVEYAKIAKERGREAAIKEMQDARK